MPGGGGVVMSPGGGVVMSLGCGVVMSPGGVMSPGVGVMSPGGRGAVLWAQCGARWAGTSSWEVAQGALSCPRQLPGLVCWLEQGWDCSH